MLSASEIIASKLQCGIGCVTRSSASGNAQPIGHSKDINLRSTINLMDLPVELIQNILSHCGYKTVANLRVVNKKMDVICGSLLNLTFNKLQNSMLTRFHSIKAQMPRRESARRQHPLACEFDIVETIYMRLNLLHMTFGKHIEKKLMYFFPGEVLDEVHRILYYIKVTPKLPRPYRVTDELFDLTTMAMEYFKEKLEPNLPEITYCGKDFIPYSPSVTRGSASDGRSLFDDRNSPMEFSLSTIQDEESNQSYPPQSNMVLRKRIRKIKQGMKIYNSQLSTMRRELKGYKTKMADQQKTILDYATRLDENDKKNEEMSRKYSTLLQELNKCKTELQYWRSKSPLNPVCGTCGAPAAALPMEDLEVLSNQGVVIPLVVVQPLNVDDEEATSKMEVEEPEPKDGQNLCSIAEDVASSSNDVSTVQEDDIDPLNPETSCSSNAFKMRAPRIPRHKQVLEKGSYKKSRGVLKLRNKTIRIMK